MVSCMLGVLFARLPGTPEKGKWTKTWPCVTWFVAALSVHGVLRECLKTIHYNCVEGVAIRGAAWLG